MIQFEAHDRPIASLRVDCLAIGLFDETPWSGAARTLDTLTKGRLKALNQRGDLSSKPGDVTLLHDLPGLRSPRLLVVGLGSRKDYQRRGWRRALGVVLAACLKSGSKSLGIAIERPAATQLDDYYLGRSVADSLARSCIGPTM